MADFYSTTALNTYALVLGVLSAVLFGRAVLFQTTQDVFDQVAAYGYWDFLTSAGGSKLLQGMLGQRYDSLAGAFVLAATFAVQFGSTWAREPDATAKARIAIWSFLLSAVLAGLALGGTALAVNRSASEEAIRLYLEYRDRPTTKPEERALIDKRVQAMRGETQTPPSQPKPQS